ncbi:hypothetical protein [Vibrio fortis]|uniref:hypothetical protein n=1 Tax=Vibrio fortis TaxID=212667 RepID=UPI00177EE561|nr:hypothetical protein [Vibrio fortis]
MTRFLCVVVVALCALLLANVVLAAVWSMVLKVSILAIVGVVVYRLLKGKT